MSDSRRSGRRPAAVEPIVSISRPADGVVVVAVRGWLGCSSLPACRRVMDDVLAGSPRDVILDLSHAHCDATAVPLLALMRRYTDRCGARLGLTPSSRPALAMLRREHLIDLLPVVAVPAVAAAAAAAARDLDGGGGSRVAS